MEACVSVRVCVWWESGDREDAIPEGTQGAKGPSAQRSPTCGLEGKSARKERMT